MKFDLCKNLQFQSSCENKSHKNLKSFQKNCLVKNNPLKVDCVEMNQNMDDWMIKDFQGLQGLEDILQNAYKIGWHE